MIYVLLAEGFEEIEALFPIDILRRAGLPLSTVAVGKNPVCGAHGIPVTADITIEDANEKIDLLFLPGGMPGAVNLDGSRAVHALLDRAVADGGHMAAICAAPLVLGHHGLLNGKRAVCYPGFEKELTGATVAEGAHVVTDGNVTTAIGMGAAEELGLTLLSLLGHGEKAKEIASAAFLAPPHTGGEA